MLQVFLEFKLAETVVQSFRILRSGHSKFWLRYKLFVRVLASAILVLVS